MPVYCLFHPTNLIEQVSDASTMSVANRKPSLVSDPPVDGEPVNLKLRVSTTGRDLTLDTRSTETVLNIKKRLTKMTDAGVTADPYDQRWYYGGRYLADKLTIEECRIPPQFVVQVIIRSESAKLYESKSKAETKRMKFKKRKKHEKRVEESGDSGENRSGTMEENEKSDSSKPAASEMHDKDASIQQQQIIPTTITNDIKTSKTRIHGSQQWGSLASEGSDPPPIE